MSTEPDKFHIGVIDFFAIMLPGAVLAFYLRSIPGLGLFGKHFPPISSETEGWIVFVIAAYILGHFIFLVGSWLDSLYDILHRRFMPDDENFPLQEALRIKKRYFGNGINEKAVNTFQWMKCRLAGENPTAFHHIQRFEADSKFFRSLVIVLLILLHATLSERDSLFAFIYLFLIIVSFWRYSECRFKSTRQAYWYAITLEKTNANNDAQQGNAMNDPTQSFQTNILKSNADYFAPDDSEIRLLSTMKGGGLCHCTLAAGKTSFPVSHPHVEEIWYVLEGQGEMWRKLGETESTVPIGAGTCLTIPPRTAFQFRNTGDGPLCILIATMPPWPGTHAAEKTLGKWPTQPSILEGDAHV